MIVAYITADSEALFSSFSDPDKFTAAAPHTFLVASLIVLIFGPGKFSFDTLLGARLSNKQRLSGLLLSPSEILWRPIDRLSRPRSER
jgi:hypothetical protein